MIQYNWALVRHGETEWNRTGRLQGRSDIPLNNTGRAQALAAAEELEARGPWDLVVSSTLGRARETARIIAKRLGAGAVVEVPALVERDYGPAEGATVGGIDEQAKTDLMAGGESTESVVLRGTAALAWLAASHRGRRLVIVSHGTLIRLVLSAIHGRDFPRVENGEVIELQGGFATATVGSDRGQETEVGPEPRQSLSHPHR
ncbi:histidine phosphatase family protein [Paeniglutamicibacter sp. ABSL32-1]|uniref:histidine phosphatase family protein n=1 Tax=Paeniglutamicibacter quisquiliarum TaxID=2849498 RepID=UPI001C2D1625|nr:histidine phosphatase family protein [Paeniglutamicibacter quisquiliarum]MBV1777632.1 histidine phosphatase family protein [Paeniglutamicibacter quisquiliarum]